MRGFHPSLSNLSDGDRIVIKRDARRTSIDAFEPAIYEVATLRMDRDDGGALISRIRHAELGDGRAFPFVSRLDETYFAGEIRDRFRLFWTLPLPDWTPAEQVEYARIMRGERSQPGFTPSRSEEHEAPSAFIVTSAEGGAVNARMVSNAYAYQSSWRTAEGAEEPLMVYELLTPEQIAACHMPADGLYASREEVLLLPGPMVDGSAVGEVLIASPDFIARDTGAGCAIELFNVAKLPRGASLERLSEAFPAREEAENPGYFGRNVNTRVNLRPLAALTYELDAHSRSGQPNEALVVVFPEERGVGQPSAHVGILTTRGRLFYTCLDAAYEPLSSEHMMPGLRHVTDVDYQTNWVAEDRVYDQDFDFVHAPATEATLAAFGLDAASLGALIADHLEPDDERYGKLSHEDLGRLFFEMTTAPAWQPDPTVPAA